MSINIVSKYSDLPNYIKDILYSNNIFVSKEYIDHIGKGSGVYILYNLEYLVVIKLKKKFFFKFCEFQSDIISISQNESNLYKLFLDNIVALLKSEFNLQWISSTPNHSIFKDYPTNSIRIPFGSYILNLHDKSIDEIFLTIHSKHRNSIKRAERNGVQIRFGNNLINDFLLLDSCTKLRRGIVKDNSTEKHLLNLLKNVPNICFIGIAYKDNIPQGGVFLLYNKRKCYYMYGASINTPEPGSMNLLHWNCILQMKEYSVNEYDFVGCRINEDEDSKYHGIQNFKKRFGGELQTGYMFKVIINDFMYKLFNFLLSIKTGNYKDIIDQEIHKWQSINR
jgi:lipid II:glycine glycyltransferase (peptidoglycan interpeptide bridge formation enzyme)